MAEAAAQVAPRPELLLPLVPSSPGSAVSPKLLTPCLVFPQDLLLAAALVSDAQYNRNIPFKTSPEAVR